MVIANRYGIVADLQPALRWLQWLQIAAANITGEKTSEIRISLTLLTQT